MPLTLVRQKSEQKEEDEDEDDNKSASDTEKPIRQQAKSSKREFRKPAGMDDLKPPIRKRKSDMPANEEEKLSESGNSEDSEEDNFADAMIDEARARRKGLPNKPEMSNDSEKKTKRRRKTREGV